MTVVSVAASGRAARAVSRLVGLWRAAVFYRPSRPGLAARLQAEAGEIAAGLSEAEVRLALAEVLRRLAVDVPARACPACGVRPAVRGGVCHSCAGAGR